jgi:hypothetical protein
MPVFLPTKTINLKLGAGSSTFPDNFTIKIFEWDVSSDAISTTGRTYATGVTKTQLANAGAGYNVTGITGNDYKVVATSTGTCTTSDDVEVYVDALSVYQPNTGTFTDIYNGYPTTPQGITFNQTGTGYGFTSFSVTGPPSSQTIIGSQTLGVFDSLSYIDASGFTLSYVSGKNLAGDTIYGDYANGPFSSFSITKSGKSFTLTGSANTSLAPDNVSIKGIIRLTHDLSTNYVDFDFWYIPANV